MAATEARRREEQQEGEEGEEGEAEPVRRRPVSAPRPGADMAAIPLIVLDGDGPPDPATAAPLATTATTTTTSNGPVGGGRAATASTRPVSGGADSPELLYEYVPHRCNSDIGLPTASMPNLTLAMSLGGGAGENGGSGGGGQLGVYCSPRTTRRSVDLDVVGGGGGLGSVGSRCGDYEWLEERTSSLRVLSAGSRVGSAVSLNSVCTAHSVGLLSNDSDDDYQDASLHDGCGSSVVSGGGVGLGLSQGGAGGEQRAGQLRRLQSYPERGGVAGEETGGEAGGVTVTVTPRTSHSLCNLKAVQDPATLGDGPPGQGQGQGHGPAQGHGQGRGQLTPEKLCLLPSDLDETDDRVLPPGDGEEEEEKKRAERRGGGGGGKKAAHREVYDDSKKVHMVSYGKGSTSMREGRIRRWLQDMDKATE